MSNGWKTHETWLVNLYLGESPGWMEEIYDKANELRGDVWDVRELGRYLEFTIKENAYDWLEASPEDMMFRDLFLSALSEVDWRELAEHYMADAEEYAA